VSLPPRSRRAAAATPESKSNAKPALAAASSKEVPQAMRAASNSLAASSPAAASGRKDLAQLLRNAEALQRDGATTKAAEDDTLIKAAEKHRQKAAAFGGKLSKPSKKTGKDLAPDGADVDAEGLAEPKVAPTAGAAPAKLPKKSKGKLAPGAKMASKRGAQGRKRGKARKSTPPEAPGAGSLSNADPSGSSDDHASTELGDLLAPTDTSAAALALAAPADAAAPSAVPDVVTLSGASEDEAGFQGHLGQVYSTSPVFDPGVLLL
jgi:hypothetical protein